MTTVPPPPPPPPMAGTATGIKPGAVFPPPPPPLNPASSPPPTSTSATPSEPLHPSHAFLHTMLPLSDALLQGLSGVDPTHPLAEMLYETCMTLRETLNLYAASSSSLLAATAVPLANPASPLSSSTLAPTSPSSSPPPASAPAPRLHEFGLESLFTRTQKVQTILQQRMWCDRSAMTHRTNIDIAVGNVSSAGTALTAPQASNLNWQSFVVYKKGHELIALDNQALSSLNLSSTGHLTCSFANASNIAPVLSPAFVSPYKLLLDLRWVTGVREVNAANASSSKEYGCELLLKFVDALPLGSSHSQAVSTGATIPQATPERFVHLRFATDADRQRIAHILRTAAHRNAVAAALAKGSIGERITIYRDLGLFPLVTKEQSSLSALETAFMFVPKWQEQFVSPAWLSSASGTSASSPIQALLPSLPQPMTPAQAAISAIPFVNTFPVVWPSREATLLAKHKARVLEVVVYPHQSTPLALGLLTSTAPTAAWMNRTNVLRIWKHATHADKGAPSSGGAVSNLSMALTGADSSIHGRTPMTGVYSDHDEKECSVVMSAGELVDWKANWDALELELTCYVTKNAPNKDEGAYNGRNTRNSSVSSPNSPLGLASSSVPTTPVASFDMLLHSKYATRKFLFPSAFHLKKFMDILKWLQSSHKDPGMDRLKLENLELKLRDWEGRIAGGGRGNRSSVAAVMPSPPAAIMTAPSTAPPSDSAPSPASHLAALISAMYQAHPSSKHCFDLYALTKDLPQNTKEGALERLQLIVRKLYACGATASSISAAAQSAAVPNVTILAEKTTGVGPMGDMKAIVCTCAGTRPLAPPSRAPPPSPSSGGVAAAPAGAIPAPPTRPPPATNSCYLLFYQAFLRAHGFQDLLHILVDATQPNSCSAMKRWALRGVWCCFEFVKPLVSASSVPLVSGGAAAGGNSGNTNNNPSSGNLKTHNAANSSVDMSNGVVNHALLTTYSIARCRCKMLTVWDEEALLFSLPQLFHGNFSSLITSLVEPGSRCIAEGQPSSNLLFHESFIDVLFEIAVNNIRLDMVYSTTSTFEPITAYLNPAVSSTAGNNAAFAQIKREGRVQVLNKQLVHLQLLPLILHLLPFSHLSATVLTLENFTWLLNGNQHNVRELLWNLEIGNGNFGGNLFILLNLANQYMESVPQPTLEQKKNYSTSYLMNSPIQKGQWDIFLDTSSPESSIILPGDPALIFNLTVTLFTTLHYQSMLIHLNSSQLFQTHAILSSASNPDGNGMSSGGVLSPASPSSNSLNGSDVLQNNDSTIGVSGAFSPTHANGKDSSGKEESKLSGKEDKVSNEKDSSERVRFRSSLLYRTMDSLRSLNGWNESTTSVFRVMIICLLNVIRSEARTFTSNFELVNSSANNFALNQFLILLYVIEEFIFFRPLAQAVGSNLTSGSSSNLNSGSPDFYTEEGDEEYSQLGLHFDFGEDFDWSEFTTIEQMLNQANQGISLPITSAPVHPKIVNDSKGNLGRVLDVPVIDKILDVFVSLKLVSPPTKGAAIMQDTSTVLGDGSADKYEKKILDFFGREYKHWQEYRSMLSTLSKATMGQNYKLQNDQVTELLALVRAHQADRLKNLTSLANYSKKSSGFFGSAFGSGKTSQALKTAYGIKDANGAGVTLHPHIFGLINKVVARAKADAASSPVSANQLVAGGAASNLATLAALTKPRSRASLIIANQNRVQAVPDPRSEAERAATLAKAKRSFQSIRHAKDFCEKERRRSSVFAAGGGSPLVSFKHNQQSISIPASPSGGLAAALASPTSAAKGSMLQGRQAPSAGLVSPTTPTTPTSNASSPPPLSGSPTSSSSTLSASPPSPSPSPAAGLPAKFPPPPPPGPPPANAAKGAKPPPPPPPPVGSVGAAKPPPPVPGSFGSSASSSGGSLLDGEDEESDFVGELSPGQSRTSGMSFGGAFQCTVCLAPLPASAFWERSGHAYCAQDFIRTFLSCMICQERIIFSEGAEETQPEREARHKREKDGLASHQYLTLAEERIVHNRCLKCDTCQKPLAPVMPAMTPDGPAPSKDTPLGSISLYQQSGKYYCQHDYFAHFGHTCSHCQQLISTGQSIQLAPEEDDDGTQQEGVSSYFHLECFVCSQCRCDLRALEAAQDEADELAFEKGEVIDPSTRPPIYQADSQGKVYCWTHWLDVAKNEPVSAAKPASRPPSSTLADREKDGPFHSNPLFAGGRQASQSFSTMIRDNGIVDYRQGPTSAPGSAPNSYVSSYLNSNDSFDSNNSMAPIGEDLDELELSTSYSRSRS